MVKIVVCYVILEFLSSQSSIYDIFFLPNTYFCQKKITKKPMLKVI